MKRTFLFKTLSILTIWLYSVSMVYGGQVMTQNERTWARQVIEKTDLNQDISKIASPNTLAVLYYTNKTGKPELNPLEKGLAVMLSYDLSKIDTIQVIERIKLQALLDEMKLDASAPITSKNAPKIGRLLGAYNLTSGAILTGMKAPLELQPYVIDVSFNNKAKLPTTSGKTDNLVRMEKKILFSITDQLSIYLTDEEKADLKVPMSKSSAALTALFIGIDHSDRGEYEQAAAMYRQAISKDPKLQLAHDALNELKSMGMAAGGNGQPNGDDGQFEDDSINTWLWVAGGVAIAGVAALALGGSSSGGDSGGSDTDTGGDGGGGGDTGLPVVKPQITSTVPAQGSAQTVPCDGGQLQFSFNKAMDPASSVGIVFSTPHTNADDPKWSGSTPSWTSAGKILVVNYSSELLCTSGSPDTMNVTISGAADSDGAFMDSQTFSFNVELP